MRLVLCFILLNTFTYSSFARTFKIMSYNVENLFDASHDENKNDWTFLPKNFPGKREGCLKERNIHRQKDCLKTDWTDQKFEMRLAQIKAVVKIENQIPDFLGLVEVENKNVVARLSKVLGYKKFEITESPDNRGIDVALLFNESNDVQEISRKEHLVPVEYATRNILEVEFLINKKVHLMFFINHWPSLANPDSWRMKAAQVLANRSREVLKLNPEMSIIAMGDFNTIDESELHPFKEILLKDNLYEDVSDTIVKTNINHNGFLGTYYYPAKDKWNYLDHFFVNQRLLSGKHLSIIKNSFEIYRPSFITHELKKKKYRFGVTEIKLVMAPKKFNEYAKTQKAIGYSDHFPILFKIETISSNTKKSFKKSKT